MIKPNDEDIQIVQDDAAPDRMVNLSNALINVLKEREATKDPFSINALEAAANSILWYMCPSTNGDAALCARMVAEVMAPTGTVN